MHRDAFIDHCLELLSPLGAARARRMFGGHGLYVDDLFIAIVMDEQLYLKVDDGARDAFVRAGSVPFTYASRDGESMTMSYYTAPEAAMESPAEMLPWARLALAAALAARARLPRRPPARRGARGAAAVRRTD